MKKYEKPTIDVLNVEPESSILASSVQGEAAAQTEYLKFGGSTSNPD